MLAKIRHFVPVNTLRSIYFGIFSSLLTYEAQVWGQFQNQHVTRLQKIQNKTIRIINFSKYNDPVDPIYHKLNVLKLCDHVKLQNFLYVHNCLNNKIPEPLKESFTFMTESCSYTRSTIENKLALPKVRTLPYGLNSIKYRSVAVWNVVANEFPSRSPQLKSIPLCKKQFIKYLIDGYNPNYN